MDAVREFPPNPHVLVLHLETSVTDQIVETYLPGSRDAPAWITQALALPGVRVLSLNLHKVRVQKHKSACWQEILEPLEQVIRAGLDIDRIDDLVESGTRSRAYPWHGESLPRQVFEGRLQAAGHPIASRILAITGVAEVIVDGNTVSVRRCPLFPWNDISPEIESCLRDSESTQGAPGTS